MTDNEIKDDLIIGRDAILDIFKLSHWKYMDRYLRTANCPIKRIGDRRWITRRSLLNVWLNDILTGKIQIAPDLPDETEEYPAVQNG